MKKYMVELTFTEPILGTVPLDKDVYSTYIAGKIAEEQRDEEVATIPFDEDKGKTGFHREDGTPFLYDYVLKGFFKDACSMLRRASENRSSKLTAFKKVIDGMVFIEPRKIPIKVVGEIGVLERPLRAETAQGPRVALAQSEMIGVGSSILFEVVVLDAKVPLAQLEEWFDYGKYRGLGQWRNGSYGRFIYAIAEA